MSIVSIPNVPQSGTPAGAVHAQQAEMSKRRRRRRR